MPKGNLKRMDDRLFILSLGRKGGSVIYGTEVINRLKRPKEIWVSAYCEMERPAGAKAVKTYMNPMQFATGSLLRLPVMLFDCWRQLRKGAYSAFYTPYFHYWNLPFMMLFKWFGKQTVITVHDGIPHSGDGKFMEAWLNKACIRRADDIIFLTAFVRDMVEKETGYSANSHIIPHGLIEHEGLKNSPRKHPGKVRLLFLGRLRFYKGIDLLIEAVRRIKNPAFAGLTIAGEKQKSFDLKINDPKISLQAKWHSESEISALVNAHDLLILPYREATQSGVVTIGISACIPMVCTKTGGLPEQLTEEEAVFVNPEVEEIKKGIQLLLDDKILYEQISLKLKEKRNRLSWDEIAKKVSQILGPGK